MTNPLSPPCFGYQEQVSPVDPQRDATNMSSAAHRLLVDDAEMAPVLKPYLVIAAMLGHITSGSPEQARAVWDRYSQKVFGDRELPEYVKLVSRIANHRGDTG